MSKRVIFAAAVLLVGLATSALRAAEPLGADANAPGTLSEYLRYAALHNAGLKAAFEQWKAALEKIPQARALPDPTFTYGYFIEQLNTRQRAGIMQVFPWFGKIEARTDAATAAAKAAHKRYEARELQLLFDVKDAFYDYLYLARATEIARANLELARHFEEVARTRYLTIAATHPDIIRAQIRVAELQYELDALERSREPTVVKLNAVLDRPAGASLPWPRQEPAPPVVVDPRAVVAALKRSNPQLQAIGFDVEQLRHEVDVAKRDFYPDIGLGVEWMEMNMGSMSGADDDVMLGLQLNLPIWRRSYKAAEQQARAAARRAQHEKQNTENELIARTARALYGYVDTGRRLSLYGDVLVPKAEQLVNAAEAAYIAGTFDFLNLIDAQQALLEFRLERERAWTGHQQRLAELEMLAGTDLSGAEYDRGRSDQASSAVHGGTSGQ
ncbi:MAG: TolC family protein [Sedimentisphaerales bacterium]|nr:TolC family protein [Sedimentisphaerales bacterium]